MYYNRPMFLKGRPVSSIDEVRATPIDYDGSVFYFPDMANQKIYTKQVNIDGTTSLHVYELKLIPEEEIKKTEYITKEEFDNAIAELKQIKMAQKF